MANENILDAGESVFFKRELERIRTKTYDVLYPSNKWIGVLPQEVGDDDVITDITHRTFDRVGVAKMGGGDYSTDFPEINIYGKETTVHVRDIQASYSYSDREIKRAAKVGLPLEASRAIATRKTMDEKLESVAKYGDANTGLTGIYGVSGTTTYSLADSAASSSTKFSTKTADEMLTDLNGMVSAIQEGTNGVESPDHLAVSLPVYRLLKTTRISDGDSNGKTVLTYFKEQNPEISVDWYAGLDTAAETSDDYDGNGMMIMWENNPDKLVLDVPMAFKTLPELREGYTHKFPCRIRTAGITVFYPKSICYAYGA